MAVVGKRWQWLFLLSLLCSGLAALLHVSGALERMEALGYDARLSWVRADTQLDSRIALVMIDEASLAALEPSAGRFPWPRSIYADLLEFLALGEAKAVAFDLLFSERQRENGGEIHDQRLAEATAESGNVIHALRLLPSDGSGQRLPAVVAGQVTGFDAGATHPIDLVLPFPELVQAAAGLGFVDLDPDVDGVVRRARVARSEAGGAVPSLALAAVAVAGGVQPRWEADGQLSVAGSAVRLGADGWAWVNYYGRYPEYSFAGLMASLAKIRAGEVADLLVDPALFKDKVVFVGASAAGLSDLKATANSAIAPGVRVHAALAANLLQGEGLREIAPQLALGLIGLLVVLTAAVVLFVARLWLQLLLPVTLAAGYGAWTVWCFQHGWIYPLAGPISGIAIAWLGALGLIGYTEGRDKRKVRRMLAQYVSPSILAAVVDKYDNVASAEVGARENVSVLFSDVRGFTSMSETLAPEQVVELLNTHFAVMVDAIFARDGTLDKFIGDAIMAFWGAPLRDPDHPLKAVQAALGMMQGLEAVNARLRAKGLPAIDIGIGVNTGDAVLGNIGSEKKLDFTVIGDTVNLASRLEGLTAKYRYPVLVSESTCQRVGASAVCGLLDRVRVKGKTQPIGVYAPLWVDGVDGDREQALTTAHQLERAFVAYQAQRWDEAASLYGELSLPGVSDVFLQRCRRYAEQGPPAGWDGVSGLDSK